MSKVCREVDYITSNEDHVRSKIYDGSLQISEAAAELLRIEKAQHNATRHELSQAMQEKASLRARLRESAQVYLKLREALKPFSDAHKSLEKAIGFDKYSFSKGDLSAARKAYEETGN